MVDEESQQKTPEPAGGAPTNRDRRPNETVIEGEVVHSETEPAPPEGEAAATGGPPSEAADAPAPAEEPVAAEAADPEPETPPPSVRPADPPPPKPPGAGAAFAAGAFGGVVVAALAAAAGFYFLPLKAALPEADAARLTALEAASSREDAATAELEKRLRALESASSGAAIAAAEKRLGALEAGAAGGAGLDKRVAALEAASAAAGPRLEAGTKAVQTLAAEVKALRADVDAARGEVPGLAQRVSKLEAGVASADLTAVAGRIDKLEAALASPKSETRVAPEKPSANDNPAAVAIVAGAIRDKLASGAPFPAEFAALAALGVDPARLAPLKALAGGAPTDAALASAFAAVEPRALAAVRPAETGGVADRMLAHLRGLVTVRELGETAGDDPQAVASQVAANLRRGDLAGALAAFGRLPEPARRAASAWASEAEGKQAALAAVQAIREAAVTRLAQGAKL